MQMKDSDLRTPLLCSNGNFYATITIVTGEEDVCLPVVSAYLLTAFEFLDFGFWMMEEVFCSILGRLFKWVDLIFVVRAERFSRSLITVMKPHPSVTHRARRPAARRYCSPLFSKKCSPLYLENIGENKKIKSVKYIPILFVPMLGCCELWLLMADSSSLTIPSQNTHPLTSLFRALSWDYI